METLYRKVTFEIEQQDHCKTVLIGKNANFIFNPNTRNGEELTDFLSGCEEIPDKPNRNTGSFLKPDQKEHADKVFELLTKKTVAKDCECDKLQADKAELLEALEIFIEQNTPTFTSHDYEFPEYVMKAKSLIQKHKQ